MGHKYEPEVRNACHHISMIAYELKNIVMLSVKGVDYRCVIWNMTRNDETNRLNNFELDGKGRLSI